SAFATYAAGFLVRPFGAILFGRIGDLVGRKYTFLVTIMVMGTSTFVVGLLPTFAPHYFPLLGSIGIGWTAPVLLVSLRLLQGLALGGEYGGAVIYVAEHAAPERRAYATSWIQASAAFGLVGALAVILAARTAMGDAAFADGGWRGGWRIPFLLSAGLLAVSIWIRLRLEESPAFRALKASGGETQAPWAEAFGRWSNLKVVLAALVAIMSAQGAAWYTLFFYAEQVFLERFLKVAPLTGAWLLILISLASAPLYVLFAALSDRVGRKWVMWFGMTLALIAFFPGFRALTHYANPALEHAQATTPVVVAADPSRCSLQFDLLGKARFATSCDIAKSVLANAGVSYANAPAAPGSVAEVRVGGRAVKSAEGQGLAPTALKAVQADVKGRVTAALRAAGYPDRADPARLKFWSLFAVLMVFVVACTALYAPIAATLVELFPTRIRYTALSLPYHVGTGWVGGFVPVTAFAIVVATGNIYAGLWYPAVFTAISVVTLPFLVPETRNRSLSEAPAPAFP
ncbi:MAG: MFS transporter, partial [Caulobacteraceae bacterium]|nr:MFS transporter [Caulobacteraceae bacterium]